jgi:hypothetical protein
MDGSGWEANEANDGSAGRPETEPAPAACQLTSLVCPFQVPP